MLCRDRIDGTLRGTLLIGINHKKDHTVISVGLANFKNHYRGSPFMNITLTGLALGELLRHPFTPIYFVGKMYSYMPYLSATRLSSKVYPCYDKETPKEIKKVIDEYGENYVKIKGGNLKYNPETNVIETEDGHLAENLAALSERSSSNPHAKFFFERNSGWKKVRMLGSTILPRIKVPL